MVELGGRTRWAALAFLGTWLFSNAGMAQTPTIVVSAPIAVEPSPQLIPSFGTEPSVATDGEGMLLVYLDKTYGHHALWARRLAADGAPLSLPFEFGAKLGFPNPPGGQVAFDGENYVVAWFEYRDEDGTIIWRYRRIGPDGALLGEPQLIKEFPVQSFYSAISGGDGRALLLFCFPDHCEPYVLVGDTLTATDQLPIPSGVRNVAVGDSDGVWLAAFEHDGATISLAQFGGDGQVIDGTEKELASGSSEEVPAVAGNADGFAISWSDYPAARIAHVDFAGNVTFAPQAIEADQDTLIPRHLHTTGTDTLVFLQTFAGACDCEPTYTILRLDHQLQPIGSPVSVGLSSSAPATTSQGEPYFFAADPGYVTGTTWDLTNGLKVGPTRTLSEKAPEMNVSLAAPAGEGWLVAWHQSHSPVTQLGYGISAAFLDTDGKPKGSAFALTDSGEHLYDLATTSRGWLIAATAPYHADVPEGGVKELTLPALALEQVSYASWYDNVSIATSPKGWLILTRNWVQDNVQVSRFAASGAFVDQTLLGSLSSPSVASKRLPLRATFDGQSYLIAWADGGKVFAKHIPLEGEIPNDAPDLLVDRVSAAPLCLATVASSWWALGADGTDESWFAFGNASTPWPDFRPQGLTPLNGYALAALDHTDKPGYALAYAAAGQDLSGAIPIDNEWDVRLSPAVDNRVLAVSSKPDNSWGPTATRLVTRIITLDVPSGGAGGAPGDPAGSAGENTGIGGARGVAGDASGMGGEAPANVGGDAGQSTDVPGTSGSPAASSGSPASIHDGGSANAGGADDGGPSGPHNSKGCGCRAAPQRGSSAIAWPLLLLAFARRRNYRRMRRRSR